MTYTDKRRIMDFIKDDPKMFLEYIEEIGVIATDVDAPYMDELFSDYTENWCVDGQFAEWCEHMEQDYA